MVTKSQISTNVIGIDVQFKVGEAIVLYNLDAEVVATRLITGVGGQGCVHHGVAIKESWFRVQLGEVVKVKATPRCWCQMRMMIPCNVY